MKKADDLKAWILACNPDRIAESADRLTLFIEKGGMAGRGAIADGFEYRYSVQLLITDYAGDYDALLVPVYAWVARNQPELLAGYTTNNHAVGFSVEQLGDGKVDLLVELDLTEAVRLVPRVGGGFDVTHLPEIAPDPEDGPRHWSLYLKDDLVAEWDEGA